MNEIETIRDRLLRAGLDAADLAMDPLDQVRDWFETAQEAGVHEPAAMTLATVDEDGAPDARIVLLRRLDTGFCWYTDRDSSKGRQLEVVARAAIVLAWTTLGRQIRATGPVSPTTAEEDDAYRATRPRASRIAAVSSHQSTEVERRSDLDDRFADVEEEYRYRDVPRPARWGGYRLTPQRVEFWQQRAHRRHDRIRYERQGPSQWGRTRLSP